MELLKFFKKKFITFGLVFVVSACLGNFIQPEAAATHENAYLACFIDEATHMYKFQVIYSGVNIEYNRVGYIWGDSLLMTEDQPGNLGLWGLAVDSLSLDGEFVQLYVSNDGDSKDGQVIMGVADTDSETYKPDLVSQLNYSGVKMNSVAPRPLTFPASARACTSKDINRAYEVQDVLCEDFVNALLFINDSKDYPSTQSLIQTAFYLVTADNGTVITNGSGNQYQISYKNSSDRNNYVYKMTITAKSGTKNVSRDFVYKVKKGYNGATANEKMESGQANLLDMTDGEFDTKYITWGHLFLEAGTLRAEGVTYDNQADLYDVSSFEEKIIGLFRNLFNGIRSFLQLYTFEDMIFSIGTRGSNAFAFGVYPESWSSNLSTMYLIFVVISFSLITISCLKVVMKKQLSTIDVVERVSLMEMIKDVILSVVMTSFGWPLFNIVMMVNSAFVSIFADFVGTETLSNTYNSYSTLAMIFFQFAYMIITIYANYVYILRGLIVPCLLCSGPFFFWLYSMGPTGRKITGSWLKEVLGNIFIQSFHAFIYGFILICTDNLRGIESLVLCAAIIPITKIFKDTIGIGGGTLMDTANALTGTTAGVMAMGGAAVAQTVGSVAGGAISMGSNVAGMAATVATGNPLIGSAISSAGGMLGNSLSGAGGVLGGATQIAGGAASSMTLGDNSGNMVMQNGFRSVGSGMDSIANSASSEFDSLAKDFRSSTSNRGGGVGSASNTGGVTGGSVGMMGGTGMSASFRAGNAIPSSPMGNAGGTVASTHSVSTTPSERTIMNNVASQKSGLGIGKVSSVAVKGNTYMSTHSINPSDPNSDAMKVVSSINMKNSTMSQFQDTRNHPERYTPQESSALKASYEQARSNYEQTCRNYGYSNMQVGKDQNGVVTSIIGFGDVKDV